MNTSTGRRHHSESLIIEVKRRARGSILMPERKFVIKQREASLHADNVLAWHNPTSRKSEPLTFPTATSAALFIIDHRLDPSTHYWEEVPA